MLSKMLAVLLIASPAVAAGDSVPGLVNARLTTHAVAGGLSRTMTNLMGNDAGPAWIGYTVPTHGDASMCCFNSISDGETRCGGCTLEGGKGSFTAQRADGRPLPLEKTEKARILYRVLQGHVVKVRAFSENCALEAGGVPVRWIHGVDPAESVAFLAALVREQASPAARKKEDVAEHALAALAAHEGAAAGRQLTRFSEASQPREIRKKAAFWLGSGRGREGYQTLKALLASDADHDFREHVIFALSVNDTPEALDAIIGAARNDEHPEVRGKALFWLGQKAGEKAVSAITHAIDDDPEDGVRDKAVFALSQLPKDEGVPHLVRLARTHRSPKVRKKAMFWLGQSGDPRALAYFEEVLAR